MIIRRRDGNNLTAQSVEVVGRRGGVDDAPVGHPVVGRWVQCRVAAHLQKALQPFPRDVNENRAAKRLSMKSRGVERSHRH